MWVDIEVSFLESTTPYPVCGNVEAGSCLCICCGVCEDFVRHGLEFGLDGRFMAHFGKESGCQIPYLILKADFDALLSASINHPSAKHIVTMATETSWCCLWDIALEHGVQGTRRLQLLLKELSRRPFDCFSCQSCGSNLNDDPSFFHHICSHHPEAIDNLSCKEIISTLKEGNIYVLSTGANSKLSTIFSVT